jgi:plastocyanin
MKTKFFLFFAGLTLLFGRVYPATVTVTNNGYVFVPNEITVEPGDTIVFSLGSTHNVVEVSKSTWDANSNTSNGGFSLGYGGGQLILNTPGVYYYVCAPHASLGMKGIITVSATAEIPSVPFATDNNREIKGVYPNPFTDKIAMDIRLAEPSSVTVLLFDMKGSFVRQIMQKHLDTGEQTEVFDLSGLKPGYYLLHYISNREDDSRSLAKVQ